MASYKELKVWQINQSCIQKAVLLIEKSPNDYAVQHITKQLFRAISSIGANIAEGQESYEGKEFVRYLNIAIRSGIEADHWLATLKNLKLEHDMIQKLELENIETIKMLKGLKRSIEEKRNI